MATPPGSSAPESDRACSFFRERERDKKKASRAGGARFLSGFFSPFFLIRGGYGMGLGLVKKLISGPVEAWI